MRSDLRVVVVGATGATGRLLVKELLARGHRATAIARSPERMGTSVLTVPKLTVARGNVLEMSEPSLSDYVAGCDALACCLGHTPSIKGIFGPPRRLVTDSVRRLCLAIRSSRPTRPVRFVLMNSAGNRNRDLRETASPTERLAVRLLRALLPPHADNEDAADYLRREIGANDDAIQWAAVRPDSLVDHDSVTPYEIYASPTRSAIFHAGKTSRINVARFMTELISDEQTWSKWKNQMPVIYNREETEQRAASNR